jgi:hypothetical protein
LAKPGATYDDYLKDRYQCILDARTQVSVGYVDAYGGALNSGQQISRPIAEACMAAKGWVRDDLNGFKPPGGGVPLGR